MTEPSTSVAESAEEQRKESETLDHPSEQRLKALYKELSASTVVVLAGESLSTGTIIAPTGVVLTNHHVVDGGVKEGLSVRVEVIRGVYSELSQSFEPEQSSLDGYVLKVDAERDLALVQLAPPSHRPGSIAARKGPKTDYPVVALSPTDPFPGQNVVAMGHAGAGLLWSIKPGYVSSTGDLAGHVGLIRGRVSARERKRLDRYTELLEQKGRVLLSTSRILPGDSGGPLVNLEGEMVGVNAFVRIDPGTRQSVSFHVHVSEVRPFLEHIPHHQIVTPDPWHQEGALASFVDEDLDGSFDAVKVASPSDRGDRTTYFFDLDQDSFPQEGEHPSWDELSESENERFDAELVVLEQGGNRWYWCDTNNDAHFDRLLLDRGARGRATYGYTLRTGAPAVRDDSPRIGTCLDPAAFQGKAKERYNRLAGVIPGTKKVGSVSVPPWVDPLEDAEFSVSDADRDGRVDTFHRHGVFHHRVLWDLDDDSGVRSGTEFTRAPKDIEVAAVHRPGALWVWYDTTGDGHLDLALGSGAAKPRNATAAVRVAKDGTWTTEEAYVGRHLLQPSLLDPAVSSRFSKVVRLSARDEPKRRKPRVREAGVRVRGVEARNVRRVVRSNVSKLRACYEQSLLAKPGLRGRVVVEFLVDPTGRVPSATIRSSTVPEALSACTTDLVQTWVFKRPKSGQQAAVVLPLEFSIAP